MRTILHPLLAFVLLACLSASSLAGGLVQVSLRGAVDSESGTSITFYVKSGSHVLDFQGMVGEGTRVGDLSALLKYKLKRSGFNVTSGEEPTGRGPVSLFIESVEEVRVRFGGGISATLTCSEEMPKQLRMLPPRMKSDFSGGDLRVYVTTREEEGGGLEVHSLQVSLPDRAGTSEGVAVELVNESVRQGLVAVRPDDGSWSSKGTVGGDVAISASVALYSDVDWGVEMILAPLVSKR
jgi:hypothetical protein